MTIAAQNLKRATRAKVALDAYAAEAYGKDHGEEIELQIADLCTDLLHLLRVEGQDPEALFGRMRRDFEAEEEDPDS